MKAFPREAKFNLSWRNYQARILRELEDLLIDNHLHVVAAPGSGKTVLGLEVVRRLNNPTLVLTPTLAIRNQWVDRLVALFLNNRKVDWISTDIKQPGFFTVSTYQGLHSAITGQYEIEGEINEEEKSQNLTKPEKKKRINIEKNEIIQKLKKVGIKTVVVDEAHHLRTKWWKSLTECLNQLEEPIILALTATPPFDVSETEWKRYRELCGPVDAEIPVPELVLEKNLCAHQDYIMFSTPSRNENEKILKFRDSVHEFTKNLYSNQAFIKLVSNHPWLAKPDEYIEEILSDPSYFSSLLVFLNHLGKKIPRNAREIVVGSQKESIPIFDYDWLEILLLGMIFSNVGNDNELPPVLDEIKRDLIQIGALERRIINLRSFKEIEKILRTSISKLNSINKIVNLEYDTLKNNLRMVILTDYIRKEFLPRNEDELTPLSKLGVLPIFESIRRNLPINLKLGILSGSIVVIPSSSEELLKECIIDCEIDIGSVKIRQTPFSPDYATVDVKGINKEKIVLIMTELFTRGGIHVLVGTAALLGEGWDAPSINSLILASFVGSYMLSNQMRGRAIRTEPNNPQKTANVWHLACVESKSSVDDDEVNEDLRVILRRFKGFVGPSFKEPLIESGVSRLDIGDPPYTNDEIISNNEIMSERARNRGKMRDEWDIALKRGDDGVKLVENIKLQKEHLPRGLIFENTIESVIKQGVLFFLFIFLITFYTFGEILFYSFFTSISWFFIIFLILLFFAILAGLPKFLKATWLFIRHGSVKSSLKQISKTLLKSLCLSGLIITDYEEIDIKITKGEAGVLYCHLEGGSNREKIIFLESLQEILDPIKNPRYILARKSLIFNRFGGLDYHAVPSVIGSKKNNALLFAEIWEKYVGEMALIYTRSRFGREILLKARNHSLSANFREPTERISRWC